MIDTYLGGAFEDTKILDYTDNYLHATFSHNSSLTNKRPMGTFLSDFFGFPDLATERIDEAFVLPNPTCEEGFHL